MIAPLDLPQLAPLQADLRAAVRYARRDAIIAAFRRKIRSHLGITQLKHQAQWQLPSEGWELTPLRPAPGDFYADVVQTTDTVAPGALVVMRSWINDIDCCTVRYKIIERPHGGAHVLADLAGYKGGKSFGSALWAAGFACIPQGIVHLVGAEYEACEPEFNYLLDFLISDRGLRLPYVKLLNDARGGRMALILKNRMKFQVKSYERADSLKGKKLLAYLFCEAYQLPGLEVLTTNAQNLREQRGFALFPTTPDRPWVGVFHDYGHGQDPDWHCTCCVDAKENPYTFDQKARDRDDPAKGGIMTRERFAIAWQGKLGRFIGRVYDFVRGDESRLFLPTTHPTLYRTDADWASE